MTENLPPEQKNYLRGVIEALLFVNEKPVTLDQMKKVVNEIAAADLKNLIQELKDEYEQKQSGMTIMEIADGYQMLSNPSYATYVKNFYQTKHKEKLSKPALESLAIIAYKQPVTRLDIESIRGVNSDGVVTHLLEKELIKVVGRKDIPGKPYIYGTTKQFLEYFGLKSLESLPKLEEFPNLQPATEPSAIIEEGTAREETTSSDEPQSSSSQEPALENNTAASENDHKVEQPQEG